MRRPIVALLLAAALLGHAVAASATEEAIDATARREQARFGIPGLSLAVFRGGQLIHARGFGLADLASKSPADANTVYPLGSISKHFTMAGVLKLVETGRITLADPVARHVPEYWPHGSAATLDQLLRHTSGVREFFSVDAAAKLVDDPRGTIDDVMALVAREPLMFAAGSRWSYSNSGYHLAARVIEKTTGEPYEKFLDAAFFAPLQLRSLHHCKQAPRPPREATGYAQRQGKVVVARWENMNTARGDGGLCGNAVDVARWLRLLARGEAITAASAAAMTQPTVTSNGRTMPYGLGLGLLPLDDRPRIGHTGEIGGFTAAVAYYPGDDLAIAVLTNRAGVPVEAIERAIARALLGLPAPRLADLPVPADLRRRLLGRWEIGIPGLVVEVAQSRGRLTVRMPPPGWSGPLQYQGRGRFAAVSAPEVRYLQIDDRAAADALTIGMGDMHWDARRVRNNPSAR